MTLENDLVLIYHDGNPMVFARVESIVADHKKDWFQIRLLILSVPPQEVTWILKEDYINGAEFTMDGQKMRLEKVAAPSAGKAEPVERPESAGDESGDKAGRQSPDDDSRGDARVISFPANPDKS
ncbi:MAG: hypothetical protein ACLFS7_00545 [Desulfosudaceae bacterium]